MSELTIREAPLQDEAAPVPMMRALDEHEPYAIHLEVDLGNEPALELYRRTGYQDHHRFLLTKWLKH